MTDKKGRTTATVLYLIVLAIIQWAVVGQGFPINEKLLWFANGVASLLLGSRLLNPHFVPPADVATNSFVAGGTLIAALAAKPALQSDLFIIWLAFSACAVCFLASMVVLLVKRPHGLETRPWVLSVERGVKAFGAPRTIFTRQPVAAHAGRCARTQEKRPARNASLEERRGRLMTDGSC